MLNKTKGNIEKLLDEQDLEKFLCSENILYESIMSNKKTTHIKKLEKLKDEHAKEINMKFNEDWFVNKTNINIPTNIQWLLSLGPKFALPNTKTTFPLFKCIADGEECIQTIESREEQEKSRTKLVSLIDDHIDNQNHNKRDKLILDTVGQTERFLGKNKNILVLNADKGNKTVILDKKDYEDKMKNILQDMCTYKRIKKDPTSILQTKNNSLIEKLFNMNLIDLSEKNKLTTKIATAPRIYGLPKIHKIGTPLRPICSSINSPSYNLCRFLVDILKNLTKDSKYNVKDSKDFKTKVNNTQIEKDEILVSFDVISLFPSIPVNLALKTIERKWSILEQFTNIPKDIFMELLTFCIKEGRYFKYEDKHFEQLKGMPMGSPASPIIADIVMEELLDVSLDKMNDKPRTLTKYVDDLFSIIKIKNIDETLKILNSFSRQIQFTMEKEMDNRLPYLDSVIIRKDNLLKLDWFQKPMASGRLINFRSKHPRRIIINTATNFITRVLDISDKTFHDKNIGHIRNILYKNDFPNKTITDLITQVKTKIHVDQSIVEKPSKIYKSITYIPGYSERILNSNIYNKEKYQLALKNENTLNKLFSKTKSKLDIEEKSNLVYKINCNGDGTNNCQKVYVGTTKTKLKTRLASHKSDLNAVNKPLSQKTALAAHCAVTGHRPDFKNVDVLMSERNYRKRYTLEMLSIVGVSNEKRLNYKIDTDKCAQIYRHSIDKHKVKYKQ